MKKYLLLITLLYSLNGYSQMDSVRISNIVKELKSYSNTHYTGTMFQAVGGMIMFVGLTSSISHSSDNIYNKPVIISGSVIFLIGVIIKETCPSHIYKAASYFNGNGICLPINYKKCTLK